MESNIKHKVRESNVYPLSLLTAALFLFSCSVEHATVDSSRSEKNNNRPKQSAMMASYYGSGDGLNGRKTASGEPLNADAMTAAHRSLPFGSVLHVVNPENGKSVKVRVNDRGPYVKGRNLDLTYGAAKELGFTGNGVHRVLVTTVPE